MTDDASLQQLYQELLLDHFKHPRCQGAMSDSDSTCLVHNPLCGDRVELKLKTGSVPGDGIGLSQVRFTGNGCSISQASASIMASLCEGRTVAQAQDLLNQFRSMMRGENSVDNFKQLGDALALEGVKKFAARIKCAQLAWEALDQCLKKLADRSQQDSDVT